MNGPSNEKEAGGAPLRERDVFGFSAPDGQEALMRNWMAMATLPWAAVWAVQSEFMEETLRRLSA